ncbi:MAG: hypothetical protein MRJ68_18605 [Nitrospira sp.]|nr:hypothetical protein [Nitrospira sp.]
MKEFINRDSGRICVIAVILNYPWERAQSVLYRAADGSVIPWWHCMLASLGDGLLVLLMCWAGRVVLGQPAWFEYPGLRGYMFMAVTGLAMIIPIEWILMNRVGWWSYTADMYLVPGVAVGVSPVMQMLLVPPLIFWIVAIWRRRHPS